MHESDSAEYSSSSEDESSSSEDFPEPNSPRRKTYHRDHDDYGTLFSKVNDNLCKCISLNRTIIDLSFDIAKEQLQRAFENSGLVIDDKGAVKKDEK